MALTRIVAPSSPVVTLPEVKAHVRVLHSDDDAVLTSLVAAAVGHLDGYQGILGLCLAPQVWELSFDTFPAGPIRMPLGPVLAVQSVRYTDAAGADVLLAGTEYQVDLTNGDGWVSPVACWPATGDFLNAARIRFEAGYAGGVVPEALRVAVMMLAGHWYNNREGQGDMPPAVAALVMPFKRVWLA